MCGIPKRAIVGIQLFLACFTSYMVRVNISTNIVAMTVPTKLKPGETVPDYGPRYDWDGKVRGYILGAYYWGAIITCFTGGFMAENFSARHVIGVSTFVGALLNAACPVSAKIHWSVVCILRFLIGLCGGVCFPTCHCLISKWVPPNEKGVFMGAMMGGTFGTVCTWAMLGFLIANVGWKSAFYVPSILILIWGLLWYMTVADSPELHSTITEEEKTLITTALGGNIPKAKRVAPYGKIFKNVRFWALACSHYGNLYGLFFLLSMGPTFLAECLNFNMKKSGVLSGTPHMARMIMGFVFGAIGDKLRKNEIMSVTAIRKFFHIFSHIIPGVFLCLLGLISDPYVAVAVLTASLGFNGASTITNLQNSQDLAPNFAGTIYGTINAIGSTSGIIGPVLSGIITASGNTMANWVLNFSIVGFLYIGSAVIFILLGSGEKQSFNDE